MPPINASRFHPKRWTAFTWLAVLLWAWQPFILNVPPFESYTVDPVTGELTKPTQYHSLAELPVPVGWPLYYVKPSYLTTPAFTAIPVGAPMPPPTPSTIHPFAIVGNIILIALAMGALVYLLQKTMYRFTLTFLLGVLTVVPLHFGLARLVGMVAGYDAVRWYFTAVFFLPIPAALAVRFEFFQRMKWRNFRSMWKQDNQSVSEHENADDAIVFASRLEMSGDWDESIELFRYIAQRWPEHSAYVQNCINRITQKQSLANM